MGIRYSDILTASINHKGVIDVDTVKGCKYGMQLNPKGCYGNCYASRSAKRFGRDFSKSIIRNIINKSVFLNHIKKLKIKSGLSFIRVGVMGDPSHDWEYVLRLCELVQSYQLELFPNPKYIIIITKHWIELTDLQIEKFSEFDDVIFNTSVSALDTCEQLEYRLKQYDKIKNKSILRIVSCDFNHLGYKGIQEELFYNELIIDNPLRCFKDYDLVTNGIINVKPFGNQFISKFNESTYTGTCKACPDMCGINL